MRVATRQAASRSLMSGIGGGSGAGTQGFAASPEERGEPGAEEETATWSFTNGACAFRSPSPTCRNHEQRRDASIPASRQIKCLDGEGLEGWTAETSARKRPVEKLLAAVEVERRREIEGGNPEPGE